MKLPKPPETIQEFIKTSTRSNLFAENRKLKACLKKIMDGTGAIPKDWDRFELLQLIGRIYDISREAEES